MASLVKLITSKTKEVGRLTKEQAVQIRKEGGNINGDTKQVTAQIVRAAAGNKKILKHKGHKLKDGSTGNPHYQTEGVSGHAFWGEIGNSLITFGVGLEMISIGLEVTDPMTYISSGNNYIDENGKN